MQLRSGKRLARIAFALAITALSSACTTPDKKVYQGEEFHAAGMYSHQFPGNAVVTCEAARRALLSQGYVVADIKADTVNGQKSFQPDSDTHVEISFHVVCVSDDAKGVTSTAFVNALQDRYAIKKTPSSASLGVGAVGAVSLPFGSSDDSLVKIASETIPPGPIYDRFFTLTGTYLAKIGTDFGPEPKHEPARVVAEPAAPVEHRESKAPDTDQPAQGVAPAKGAASEGAPDKTSAAGAATTSAAAPLSPQAGGSPAQAAAASTPAPTAPAAAAAAPAASPAASPPGSSSGAAPSAIQSMSPAAGASQGDNSAAPAVVAPRHAQGLIDS
jgi:hypothetical protein